MIRTFFSESGYSDGTRPDPEWWELDAGFFGPAYLAEYTEALPHERTLQEAGFIAEKLKLKAGTKVLDMPCGHGRHSVELAKRGCVVTGLDVNAFFLEKAREAATAANVEVDFRWADMREHNPELDGKFDIGLNLFTALGYFESPPDDVLVMQNLYQALKPGGHFVIDYFNHDWAMRNFKQKDWRKLPDGSYLLIERKYDPVRNQNTDHRVRVKDGQVESEMDTTLYLYTTRQLIDMAHRVGFKLQESFGCFEGSPLTMDSKRIILIFKKTVL